MRPNLTHRAAWGKANNVRKNEILFLSDKGSKFSKTIGWNNNEKAFRYAMVIDKGVVVYAGKDERGHFEVSDDIGRIEYMLCSTNISFSAEFFS